MPYSPLTDELLKIAESLANTPEVDKRLVLLEQMARILDNLQEERSRQARAS